MVTVFLIIACVLSCILLFSFDWTKNNGTIVKIAILLSIMAIFVIIDGRMYDGPDQENVSVAVTPYEIGSTCTVDGGRSFFIIKKSYYDLVDWRYDVVILQDDKTSLGIYTGLWHTIIDYCDEPNGK